MPAISESAGWGPVCWWLRNNFVASKDINRSQSFSENWRPWLLLSPRLSNTGRRRKVGYARAATFHGKSGDPSDEAVHISRDEPITVGTIRAQRVTGWAQK